MARLASTSLALALMLAFVGACRRGPEPVPADSGKGEQAEPPTQTKDPPEPPMCDGQPCEAPRECISYFGIAGPSGPTFYACEIRCDRNASEGCPDGTRCVTIADGPGDVCR